MATVDPSNPRFHNEVDLRDDFEFKRNRGTGKVMGFSS